MTTIRTILARLLRAASGGLARAADAINPPRDGGAGEEK